MSCFKRASKQIDTRTLQVKKFKNMPQIIANKNIIQVYTKIDKTEFKNIIIWTIQHFFKFQIHLED